MPPPPPPLLSSSSLGGRPTAPDRATLDFRHSAYQTWLLADAACWLTDDPATASTPANRDEEAAGSRTATRVRAKEPAAAVVAPEPAFPPPIHPPESRPIPSPPHAPQGKARGGALASVLSTKRSKSALSLAPKQAPVAWDWLKLGDDTAPAATRPRSPASAEIDAWRLGPPSATLDGPFSLLLPGPPTSWASRDHPSTLGSRTSISSLSTLGPKLSAGTSEATTVASPAMRVRTVSGVTPEARVEAAEGISRPSKPQPKLVRRPSLIARMLGRKRSMNARPLAIAVAVPPPLPLLLVPTLELGRPDSPLSSHEREGVGDAHEAATQGAHALGRVLSKRGVKRPFPAAPQHSPRTDEHAGGRPPLTPRSHSGRSPVLPSAPASPRGGVEDQYVVRYQDLLTVSASSSAGGERSGRPSTKGGSWVDKLESDEQGVGPFTC